MGLALNYDLLHNWLENGAFVRISESEFYIYLFDSSSSEIKPIFDEIVICEFFAKQFQLHKALVLKFNRKEFIEALKPHASSETWQEPDIDASKDLFARDLHTIQQKIEQGQITKAVPLMCSSWSKLPSHSTRAQWILKALEAPFSLLPFGFWKKDQGILGATPEILFSLKNDKLITMALAGTLPKELGAGDQLLSDEKELSEHRFVVEDIQKRLTPFGDLNTQKTRVVELPTLYHLRTDFELTLAKKHSPGHWISLLHPTPALGVSPREYGIAWMQEMPVQKNRKQYGGPIYFPFGDGDGVALVAIRAIEWHSQKTYLNAGCGVVKESQLDKEWNELRSKQNSVLKILGMR